jgi:hypothetical protein
MLGFTHLPIFLRKVPETTSVEMMSLWLSKELFAGVRSFQEAAGGFGLGLVSATGAG